MTLLTTFAAFFGLVMLLGMVNDNAATCTGSDADRVYYCKTFQKGESGLHIVIPWLFRYHRCVLLNVSNSEYVVVFFFLQNFLVNDSLGKINKLLEQMFTIKCLYIYCTLAVIFILVVILYTKLMSCLQSLPIK